MPENHAAPKALRLGLDCWTRFKAGVLDYLATAESEADGEGFSPVSRLFLWLCAALVLLFLLWAAASPLDIVSVATGQVIPATKVKSVQHLEGGIVREIKVREGDVVKVGQPLVILEETGAGSSVEELEVRINALGVDAARLEAEAEGLAAPEFPDDLVRRQPQLVAQAMDIFRGRKARLDSELAAQRENMTQAERDIEEIEARLRNTMQALAYTREQIKISDQLLAEGLTPRSKHLALLREESGLVSKVEQDRAALPRAQSSLVESREKFKKVRQTFSEEARESLKKTRQELEEFTQRLRKFADSLTRTIIRSPVEGVVKTVRIATVGGVVKAGADIIDIVPSEDRLVVEAHLPISDIGYVQTRQKAVVTLASRDAGRFGRITGQVTQVSPDTLSDEKGRTFYTVRIETAQSGFTHGKFEYKLIPGMQVIAYIHTGERTVLEYLLDPFLATMDVALSER